MRTIEAIAAKEKAPPQSAHCTMSLHNENKFLKCVKISQHKPVQKLCVVQLCHLQEAQCLFFLLLILAFD